MTQNEPKKYYKIHNNEFYYRRHKENIESNGGVVTANRVQGLIKMAYWYPLAKKEELSNRRKKAEVICLQNMEKEITEIEIPVKDTEIMINTETFTAVIDFETGYEYTQMIVEVIHNEKDYKSPHVILSYKVTVKDIENNEHIIKEIKR